MLAYRQTYMWSGFTKRDRYWGKNVKRDRKNARADSKVSLAAGELWVKVKKDWRDSPGAL